jgi:hypothetical protein
MSKISLIKKASGESQPFQSSKLEASLKRAGASDSLISNIVIEVERWLYEGVSTKKIYNKAFDLLRKKKRSLAARYSLKNALMDLGPSGFPFEHLVGQIFKQQGFDVQVGQLVQGQCVQHEVDVVATRGNKQYLVECKFYNSPGKHANVQVPLYIRSRVYDIESKRKALPEYNNFSFHGWIVTNTRFTTDAIDYGKCSGLHLVSWDYPKGHSLKEMIEKEHFYPITALTELSKKEKQFLMDKGIVLCKQILNDQSVLDDLRLKESKLRFVMEEVEDLC